MDQDNRNTEWLQFIRNAEFAKVLTKFPIKKNIKVLEIGGGDGFIAKKIHDQGYEITSIDQIPKYPQYFPVTKGNASELNYEDEEFDIIFSSHVIAHINEIELFFDECKKVLRKNGLIIHVVPSTAWSIGTNFWHYILLPKFFMKLRRSNLLSADTNNADKNIKKKEKMVKKIINVLFLHPLGTNPSFIHEFYYFSKYRWRKLFQNQGFKVINVENGPYFYSGHSILKNKLLVIRKILAKSGFTGSFCFVLKK
jgi:ubiquinone/menaquinone biosynthesis C-methylase UbiE